MTEVREFTRKINMRPSCMSRVNWQEETSNFRFRRIRSIVMRMEDDEVCQLLCEYIIETYCKMNHECPDRISSILQQCCQERKAKMELVLRKQALDEKARNLDKTMPAYDDMERTNAPFACDNLFSSHYYQEYHRLQRENEQLRELLYDCTKNSSDVISKARVDGIRSVVEQLIVYGEQFPSNQNDRAEIIKEALLAKSFNGHIPSDALTPEWKKRLMNLGRKEMGVSFQGESMFKITGNDKVNIGGGNG